MDINLPQILIMDDDNQRSLSLKTILEFFEFEVTICSPSFLAKKQSTNNQYTGIFISQANDKIATVIRQVKETYPKAYTLLLAEKSSINQIPSTLRKLVDDVQVWPTNYSKLAKQIDNMKARHEKQVFAKKASKSKGLSGTSPAINQVKKMIKQVADSEVTVLVLGESGTGKEVVARSLHRLSNRHEKPFVPVNCGAIPGELLESELFGHEKGAFTGALTARQGRFEMAEGGTLFLDEIGDMPLSMQVKLLRVLQERTFERVGSNQTVKCDVRIIAATHRNLEKAIEDNTFREDLFYRLNVFPIEVPSLRDRTEDIPELVNEFIKKIETEKRGYFTIGSSALELLQKHDWPGNTRELANLIERLAILYPYGEVNAENLPEKFQQYTLSDDWLIKGKEIEQVLIDRANPAATLNHNITIPLEGIDLKGHLSRLECDMIKKALEECDGVVTHAADRLKMRRTTLVEKLRKYGLQKECFS